ncbi:FAD-dependent oxidoreductase [Microbacterium murale]|uniref:FAD-dependent oxidoreductase n=1 Tax=Microbacterium murale TaxID=1081040 RepID=A0ABQ1RL74_9MICO|nr:FAD-dependent oxidoreductase [Microbacterium murale]GGD70575.1 FAD-dependent oxidoreductase [Microbacterium murale]
MARKILVVGGGIGGLSAAIALRQEGHEVHVVERYPDAHASVFGVGIIQPINALRALDALGCAQACIDAGYPAKAWGAMYDHDGNFIRDIHGTPIESSTLPPMNGVTRPKLHEILTARALEIGVSIQYSTAFETLEERADDVLVTLEGGAQITADVVVGADGVRSKVRGYVLDAELQPRYIGQSAYRQNMPALPEIDRIILQDGPSGMAGFVPIGPDLAYMFFNKPMERGERPATEDLPKALRKELEGFGGLAGRFRDEFLSEDPADIVLRPEESLIAPAPWHRGRVILMGDAVHAITPHLGQGAAQAIEDGVVLGEVLTAHDDHEAAFEEFTARRFERCKLIVETSLNIGEWEMGRLPDFDNVAATMHVLKEMAKPL